MSGICGYDGGPISYIARPTIDLVPIADVENPKNAYATYDEEMVKIVPIIDTGHAANTTEEYGYFSDSFIGYIGKSCDIIYPLLYVGNALTHVKSARKNRYGWKDMIALNYHFLGTKNMGNLQKQACMKLQNLTY